MKEYLTSSMMIERGDDSLEVSIDGYVHYYVDNDYGADADGNRSVSKTFAEEVSDIAAYDVTGKEITITPEEFQEAEQLLFDKFFAN